MTKAALHLCLGAAVALTSGAALAESCPRSGEAGKRKAADCKPSERLQPYDPDKVRAGREPGFIDLGQGSELRVGGRVRMDYDVRR
jgi:hypothetical protein